MVAENNEYISSTLESMYLSNADYNVIKIAREREDFLRYQKAREQRIAQLTTENSKLRELLEKNDISYESSER